MTLTNARQLFILLMALGVSVGTSVSARGETVGEMADAAATAPAAVCDADCAQTMGTTLADLDSDLPAIVAKIKALNPLLITGEKDPAWSDFNDLAQLYPRLRALNDRLTKSGHMSAFMELLPQLRAWLDQDPAYQALMTAAGRAQAETSFKATQSELRTQYQYAIDHLNRQLPHVLKIPTRHVPLDQRVPVVNEQGRALVRQLEASMSRRFATSGYASKDELETKLRASTDPNVQKALSLLDNDQIELAVHRPEKARFWIPKVGFHNQYVTSSSRGMFNPDSRMTVEAALLDEPSVDEYRKLDIEAMPKYGTLRPKPATGLSIQGSWGREATAYYGGDVYILRKSAVQDRLSFTPGDSLDNYFGRSGRGFVSPKKWDDAFIPWSYLVTMVPFMTSDLATQHFAQPTTNPTLLQCTYNEQLYWEIQIYGALRLSDVEIFEFDFDPPNGQFLIELLNRGIKIRDGRHQPAVDWTPSAAEIRAAKASFL